MRIAITLILAAVSLLITQTLSAQNFEEYVSTDYEVNKAWFVIVDQDNSRSFATSFERQGSQIVVQGHLGGLSENALVGAALLTDSGEVISTRLHSPWRREQSIETGREKLSEEKRVRSAIQGQVTRMKQLEGELHLLTLEKRKQAGLDQVDRIYERLTQLESEIAAAKKIADLDGNL